MKTEPAIQTVIITGAARGIGFGIAQCFAQQNANIVIADVNGEEAQNAAEKIRGHGASDAAGIACDVTEKEQVDRMIAETVKRFGRVDVLVNNAGICPFVNVMDMTPEVWKKTLDINLTGAFYCTQAAARQMIEQGDGGRIVFITSLSENVTGPNQVDYGASKAGMRMAMRGFATALGEHGITCNAVAPGMILTDMTRHHWEKPEPAAFIRKRVPMGRIGLPSDIGKAVVFLASSDAEYISGVTLRVDGGHQAVCA